MAPFAKELLVDNNAKTEKPKMRLNKEDCLARAKEFRKAAELFRKAQNLELAEDCIDKAILEEALGERGPIGNLVITKDMIGTA